MAVDTTTILIVVLVFVMIAVVWLELRYLRRKSKARRQRTATRPEELQDEAHNALVTTRAIATSLAERSGIRSEEVDSLLREAQMAYSRRNYRVTIDLTSRIKERLTTLRSEQTAAAPPTSAGALSDLEDLAPSSEDEEPTTKELLQRDYPPNLIQSRFAISMAETSIAEGETAGREVGQAQAFLATARARFDAKDYSGALTIARQAEKSARGEPVTAAIAAVPAPPTPPTPTSTPPTPAPVAAAVGSVCPSCGAALKTDDAFCRKCGTQVVLTKCPTCGNPLLADDAFCRRCGTRIQR